MFGYLDFIFLSYTGRIGRMTFWVSTAVLAVVQGAIGLWLLSMTGDLLARSETNPALADQLFSHVLLPSILIYGVFLYPTLAIYTKRWHDRDKSGWWSLINLVPFFGAFWAVLELGFFGGDAGVNSYGTR